MDNMRFKELRKDYLKQYPEMTDFLFSVKYGIERFLYRLSLSDYRHNFVLKGGYLMGLLFSEGMRATKDLDLSFRHGQGSLNRIKEILLTICQIDGQDDMSYDLLGIEEIKGNDIYPAMTVKMLAKFNHSNERIPFHLDIAIGDEITPAPVLQEFSLFVNEKKGKEQSIKLLAYPVATILAEKLEIILKRGTLNTRSKDFYDMHLLLNGEYQISECLEAFKKTVEFRKTDVIYFDYDEFKLTLSEIRKDQKMFQQWDNYVSGDARYAKGIGFENIIIEIENYVGELWQQYL